LRANIARKKEFMLFCKVCATFEEGTVEILMDIDFVGRRFA
jgi:hypothetical protein